MFNALAINLHTIMATPNLSHWLGTDELGRDMLARVINGAALSLSVGLLVLLCAGTIGITVGLLSGWLGRRADALLMWITDVFLSFPGVLMAIAFAALAGPGIGHTVAALSLVGWVTFARLTRVQVLALKNEDYIKAAQLSGVAAPLVVLRYVLPNISAVLIVEAVFTVAGAIIAEAGLSFLGIGISPPTPSLGTMLREGARYMLVAPHMVLVPGLMLTLLVLGLNMVGEKLRTHQAVKTI